MVSKKKQIKRLREAAATAKAQAKYFDQLADYYEATLPDDEPGTEELETEDADDPGSLPPIPPPIPPK